MQSLPPASSKRKRCLLGCSKARDARGQKKRSSNRQNKKKEIRRCQKRFRQENGEKGREGERDNATPFSSSLFMESIRGVFIFPSRDAFDVVAYSASEQRPGQDGRDRFLFASTLVCRILT